MRHCSAVTGIILFGVLPRRTANWVGAEIPAAHLAVGASLTLVNGTSLVFFSLTVQIIEASLETTSSNRLTVISAVAWTSS